MRLRCTQRCIMKSRPRSRESPERPFQPTLKTTLTPLCAHAGEGRPHPCLSFREAVGGDSRGFSPWASLFAWFLVECLVRAVSVTLSVRLV